MLGRCVFLFTIYKYFYLLSRSHSEILLKLYSPHSRALIFESMCHVFYHNRPRNYLKNNLFFQCRKRENTKARVYTLVPVCRSKPCLICAMLRNSNILTVNYSVKQSHFTKPTPEPRAKNSEESNEAFDRVIR